MINSKNFCMGCMAPKESDGPCVLCGYTEGEPVNADSMAPGTILCDRYLLGKVSHQNGESMTYIGYDQQEEMKVSVRELMPGKLATRNHSNNHLKPLKDCDALYKGLMTEFDDICKRLKSLNTMRNIMPLIDILYENNTMYAIYRYIAVLPLSGMIAKCGGEMKWGTCKKIFLSLLNTLSQVHKKGLIHAGISPHTIFMDEKGNPYLTAFSLNATRSLHSEIDSELFDGYSAPEQYEAKRCYGEWTDVYGICAVLYRTITGTMPPNAQDRRHGDNLVDASELDNSIPQNISGAIHNGMILFPQSRTQNADELSMQLLDNMDSNTAIYSVETAETVTRTVLQPAADDVARSAFGTDTEVHDSSTSALTAQEDRHEAQENAKKSGKRIHMMVSVFISMLLTTALLGGVIWYLLNFKIDVLFQGSSSSVSVPDADIESGTEDVPLVPDLVGQYIDSITANASYALAFEIKTIYEYNDSYANGVVFQQSLKAETPMPEHGVMVLSVSKGKDSLKMPQLEGSSLDLAIQTIKDLELKYEIVPVANDSYAENIVKYTEPPADTPIKRSDKGLTILLYTKAISKSSVSEAPASNSVKSDPEDSSSSKYKTSKPPEPSKPTAKKREVSSSSSSKSWRDE